MDPVLAYLYVTDFFGRFSKRVQGRKAYLAGASLGLLSLGALLTGNVAWSFTTAVQAATIIGFRRAIG